MLEFTLHNWQALEMAHYTKHRMSHVLGYIDVKPLRVASENDYLMCKENNYACLKVLVVLSMSFEVLYCTVFPGSFGRALLHPSNPMNLPRAMKFRGSQLYCNPVFLTDRKICPEYSPYVFVSNKNVYVNNVRLIIERFFGVSVAVNRYFMSRTWIEHNHMARHMYGNGVN